MSNAERHYITRLSHGDGVDFGMLVVNTFMQFHRTAGGFARFAPFVFYSHDVFGFDILSVHAVRSDKERMIVKSDGERSLRAGEKILIVRSVNKRAHFLSQLPTRKTWE